MTAAVAPAPTSPDRTSVAVSGRQRPSFARRGGRPGPPVGGEPGASGEPGTGGTGAGAPAVAAGRGAVIVGGAKLVEFLSDGSPCVSY